LPKPALSDCEPTNPYRLIAQKSSRVRWKIRLERMRATGWRVRFEPAKRMHATGWRVRRRPPKSLPDRPA